MKKILLVVTGSIAAPKALDLYNLLIKKYEVTLIATPTAFKFAKFDNLLVHSEFLNEKFYDQETLISHTNIAAEHELIVVYPATMNFIAKSALAIPDNLALATFLASSKTKIIFPAMNHNMYLNPGLQNNLKILQNDVNVRIVSPNTGILACKMVGIGRVKEAIEAYEVIDSYLNLKTLNLNNKVILINYGVTKTYIDDIRYISNNSSGKLGNAIIKVCLQAGAKVIAVVGAVKVPIINHENLLTIPADTNQEMLRIMEQYYSQADIVFSAAALNDFLIPDQIKGKIQKRSNNNVILNLEPNIDVLKILGSKKTKQLLIGFSAEDDSKQSWKTKMLEKNCDAMVINHIDTMGQDVTNLNFYFNGKNNFLKGEKIIVAQKLVEILSNYYNEEK